MREEEDGPDAWGRPVSGATRASGGAVGARWQAGPGECGVTRLSERAGGGERDGPLRAGPKEREIGLGRWRARREEWAG